VVTSATGSGRSLRTDPLCMVGVSDGGPYLPSPRPHHGTVLLVEVLVGTDVTAIPTPGPVISSPGYRFTGEEITPLEVGIAVTSGPGDGVAALRPHPTRSTAV
jgi:hypothetical protein